jgi:membrane-bound inhibitor of C-type lysozyme
VTSARHRNCCVAAIVATVCAVSIEPAAAQTFVNYVCGGGKPVVAAFFPGERAVRVQLDGHAMTLKQRISASGARYSKAGVQLWIKGKAAMLKRRGQAWVTCASDQ